MTFNIIKSTRLDTLSKILNVRLVTLSILVFIATSTSAQNCGDVIHDTGGSSGAYGNSENWSQAYNAAVGETMNISFSHFNVESNYDFLYVYDGPNDSSPLLAQLTGNSLPSDYTSTSNLFQSSLHLMAQMLGLDLHSPYHVIVLRFQNAL